MSSVVHLFRCASVDPEMVQALCDAYDKVRASMHDKGQPDILKEVIAQRIIAAAKQGERDQNRLCALALVGLGLEAAER